MIRLFTVLSIAAMTLAGCQDEGAETLPAPLSLSMEAVGYYCQMDVLEHTGPKAQIHLAGMPYPIWFTQIRDAIAFTHLPGESKDYVAIYVNDMARAPNWEQPGADNWILADDAYFVLNSTVKGSMGAPETVPFGNEKAAQSFVADNGGEIVRFKEIPADYVLAPVELDDQTFSANPVSYSEVLGQ